jgi:AraC family transcriptional regulator of adaptative response / DNA-3-methyladenine glycosylase II
MSENGARALSLCFTLRLMVLDTDVCYRAIRARDARFDGRFFTAVRTTRVYCRPVCTAPLPRRENCRFFGSAAAAEHAGFRPCLRCRPELAPGNASIDASARLARDAASRIDDGALTDRSLASIARALGVTDRHLRRVFEAEFGVTPIAYAQTARLLLAKRLLTDSAMSVLDVAMAAGFGSVRRMNTLFAQRYRMSPSALRASRAAARPADVHVFRLPTRQPFDFDALLNFLSARAIDGVENVDHRVYRRTLRYTLADGKSVAGWIEVKPAAVAPAPARANAPAGVEARIDARLSPAIARALAACKHAFDLDCRPDEVALSLGELARDHPGLRLPGAFDGFELGVRAILGQQITVKAARTLAARFVAAFGDPIDTPFAAVTRLFPTPSTAAALTPADIAPLGIVAQRARAIVALAQAVQRGLVLAPGAEVEATIAALRGIGGIGAWTAHYIAMRALHWPDAFPPGDVALLKALGESRPAPATRRAEAWRPWRSYAVMHLWKSLEKTR